MTPLRLFGAGGGPIGARMNTRFPCFLTLALLLALPAWLAVFGSVVMFSAVMRVSKPA